MKFPTSVIKIRYAVGAMLAISAVFAIVLSGTNGSDDMALGQGPSNADDLKRQVSLLETVVANPDFQIDDAKTRADKVAAVTWDHDDDSDTADISILPTVSVKASGSTTAVNVSVPDALDPEGSYYGTFWDDDGTNGALTNARRDETQHLTDSAGSTTFLDSAYNGEAVAKDVEDLKAATVTVGNVNYSLQESSKSFIDRWFLENLSHWYLDHDMEETLNLWKSYLLRNEGGYYDANGNKANLTEFGSTTDNVTDDAVVDALNALFTKGTGGNADTGSLVHLKKIRNDEKTALEGILAILKAVQGAVGKAQSTIMDDSISDGRFDYTASGAPSDRDATWRELIGMAESLHDLPFLDHEFIYGDELTAYGYVWDVFLSKGMYILGDDRQVYFPEDGVAVRRSDNLLRALRVYKIDNLNAITSISDIRGLRRDLVDALKTDLTNHVIDALEALKELDDDVAVQKVAILELQDLLTKVDDLNTLVAGDPLHQGKVTINQDDDLETGEYFGIIHISSAMWDLNNALVDRYINRVVDTDGAGTGTAGVYEDTLAVNRLANGDFGTGNNSVYGRVSTLATALTNCLDTTDTTDCDSAAADELLTALMKYSDRVGYHLVNTLDKIVTIEELADSLGVGIDDKGTTNDTTDDEIRPSQLSYVASNTQELDDVIRVAHAKNNVTLSSAVINAINSLSGAVEDEMVERIDRVAVNVASYRSNSLQYEAFAAMAALLKALEDVSTATDADLSAKVTTARQALTAAYSYRDDYYSYGKQVVTAAYTELSRSSYHAYAQRAALVEVNKALTAEFEDRPTIDALTASIQTALKDTQSPAEQQAQATISKIEPSIRGVTLSAEDTVRLKVEIYGTQGVMDQDLAWGLDKESGTDDDITFDWGSASSDTGHSIVYTAPSSPGTYTVTASLDPNECYHKDAEDQQEMCSASFEIKVLRPSAPQPEDEAPVNPAGEITDILADSDGKQYEVFTPVDGGTFDAGEGYSIVAPSGAVPNGEFIGVRMSDDGAASNMGMTHQRYTLGGNMYGVHVVDSTGAMISDYVLEDPAKVCVPLPNMFRASISDLALVTINSDNSLTILAATVRLNSDAGGGASVCGNLSNLPASVAVGSTGAPDAIPTATPIPTPEPPDTGGTAPSSSGALWLLLILGIATIALGFVFVQNRNRRESASSNNNGI